MSNKTYGKPLACITPLLLVAAAPIGGYGIYVLCGIGVIVLAALICLLAKRRSPRKGDMKSESKNGTGLQESAPRPTETVLRDRRKEPVVKAAAQLARQLHKGQLDKAGRDYFEGHLTTVANAGTNWMEMTVGYLHDAAEDTYYSVPQIIQMLKDTLAATPADNSYVPPTYEEWLDLAEALELLNANTAHTREAYIERFRGHELALRVKLNDMQNNMDLSRLPSPGERDIIRLEKCWKNSRTNEDEKHTRYPALPGIRRIRLHGHREDGRQRRQHNQGNHSLRGKGRGHDVSRQIRTLIRS